MSFVVFGVVVTPERNPSPRKMAKILEKHH